MLREDARRGRSVLPPVDFRRSTTKTSVREHRAAVAGSRPSSLVKPGSHRREATLRPRRCIVHESIDRSSANAPRFTKRCQSHYAGDDPPGKSQSTYRSRNSTSDSPFRHFAPSCKVAIFGSPIGRAKRWIGEDQLDAPLESGRDLAAGPLLASALANWRFAVFTPNSPRLSMASRIIRSDLSIRRRGYL